MIILTGGAGFIGSCFLWKLNQEGEKDILVVDDMGEAPDLKKKNLLNKSYTDYLEKDVFLRNLNEGKVPKDVKAVFHIGACTSTTETNEQYLKENNLEYSKALAKWSLDNKVPFYYASSAAVYGDGGLGYSDQDKLTPKLYPLNLYGKSKHLFDLWLIENKLTNKVVGFRYFNVFGPNEYHKGDMRSLVCKAYSQVKKDKIIRLFKSYKKEYQDGEQKRDFVYVKDAIELMYTFYRACRQAGKNGKIKGIYNLGTGTARTWNSLATAVFKALNFEPHIEYIEMPESIKDRYQYFTEADFTKLKRSGINFNFTSLEDAVADYVKNYLGNGFAHL